MAKKRSHKTPKGISASSWLAASLLLVGLAVLAGFYLEGNTRITGVEFAGNYYTSESDLEESLVSPVGMMADSVNYSELFQSLQALPYVERVDVSMGMRGKLKFTVSERMPLALLADGSDRIYVAEGGFKLPIVPEKISDVPVVYGFSAEPAADTLNSDAFKQVESFLKEARANEFGWISISEVAWSQREGVTALSSENGVKLIFGKNNFSEKISYWEAFYSEIIPREGIQSFRSIDLRFRDQIVTQKL